MCDGIVQAAQALAEPARLAVEKLAAGAGRLFDPVHIRRLAKANADKDLIEAIGREDVAALLRAAQHRESYRRIRQELNLKLIADRAQQLFAEEERLDGAKPPADEWVDEFTDQSRDASTDELRELWSRLYLAETKKAGAVPRRILRIVRDLDANLARAFTRLLACCITADDGRKVVALFKGWIDGLDLTLREFNELVDVGLIRTCVTSLIIPVAVDEASG